LITGLFEGRVGVGLELGMVTDSLQSLVFSDVALQSPKAKQSISQTCSMFTYDKRRCVREMLSKAIDEVCEGRPSKRSAFDSRVSRLKEVLHKKHLK
jgi:hypothetical protein